MDLLLILRIYVFSICCLEYSWFLVPADLMFNKSVFKKRLCSVHLFLSFFLSIIKLMFCVIGVGNWKKLKLDKMLKNCWFNNLTDFKLMWTYCYCQVSRPRFQSSLFEKYLNLQKLQHTQYTFPLAGCPTHTPAMDN